MDAAELRAVLAGLQPGTGSKQNLIETIRRAGHYMHRKLRSIRGGHIRSIRSGFSHLPRARKPLPILSREGTRALASHRAVRPRESCPRGDSPLSWYN